MSDFFKQLTGRMFDSIARVEPRPIAPFTEAEPEPAMTHWASSRETPAMLTSTKRTTNSADPARRTPAHPGKSPSGAVAAVPRPAQDDQHLPSTSPAQTDEHTTATAGRVPSASEEANALKTVRHEWPATQTGQGLSPRQLEANGTERTVAEVRAHRATPDGKPAEGKPQSDANGNPLGTATVEGRQHVETADLDGSRRLSTFVERPSKPTPPAQADRGKSTGSSPAGSEEVQWASGQAEPGQAEPGRAEPGQAESQPVRDAESSRVDDREAAPKITPPQPRPAREMRRNGPPDAGPKLRSIRSRDTASLGFETTRSSEPASQRTDAATSSPPILNISINTVEVHRPSQPAASASRQPPAISLDNYLERRR